MTTRRSAGRHPWVRVAVAVGVATVPAVLVWNACEGPGWVGDGPSYRFVTLSALVGLVAGFAAVTLAIVQVLAGEPFGLFTSRRPAAIPALWLVAMLAAGLGACGAMATQQGDTAWEASDKGWFAGWVLHGSVIAGLLVLLWWMRARAVWIVLAPALTGLLAFLIAPPAGWANEDADFRDGAVFADGMRDVLPHTFVAALLLGAVVALVAARALSSGSSGPPRERSGSGVSDTYA